MRIKELLGPADLWLESRSKQVLAVLSAACLLIVFTIDYLTPTELHLTAFYLLPVSFAAWYIGRRVGLAAAFISAAAWHYADTINRTALLSFWNVAIVYGIFAANALSVSRLKKDHAYQRRLQDELRQAQARIAELAAQPTLCAKCARPAR